MAAGSAASCPGGSGQLADGLANVRDHRQAPRTPLAAASRRPLGIGFVSHNRPPDAGRAAPNWVRFARLLRVSYPCGPVPPGAAGQIGFVLHNRPSPPNLVPPGLAGIGFVSYDRPPDGGRAFPELGSFCTFGPRPVPPRPRPTGCRWKLGLFCTIGLAGAREHICPASRTPAAPSRRAPPGKLGSFCASRPSGPWPTGDIGFVLHACLASYAPGPLSHRASPGNWVRFAHSSRARTPCGPVPPGAAGGIGFVLHVCRENWLRGDHGE